MKRQPPTQIFVDDGYPEASDYDTNFIHYDPSIRGSCERALLEAQRRRKMQTTHYPKSPPLFFKTPPSLLWKNKSS